MRCLADNRRPLEKDIKNTCGALADSGCPYKTHVEQLGNRMQIIENTR